MTRSHLLAALVSLSAISLSAVSVASDAGPSPSDARAEHEHPLQGAGVPQEEAPGILVLATDRGFMGNEEVRAAFESFVAVERQSARLVFVTDERSVARAQHAVTALHEEGVERVAVLPLFVAPSDPDLSLVRSALADATAPIVWAAPFGGSYFAVDALAEQLRGIEDAGRRSVVVLGYGAADPTSREAMERDLQQIADRAAAGLGFKQVTALVAYDAEGAEAEAREREVRRDLVAAMRGPGRPALVLFHLGPKLDSMMSLAAAVQRHLPDRVTFVDGDLGTDPALATWMTRETRKATGLGWEDLGVVFLAHGSDYEWNEAMREAAEGLADRVMVEFAFCMADQPVIEQAVRRLEERGARAIVVVRIFGLEQSFKGTVERMFGLDVEAGGHGGHAGHGMGGHGHGGHGATPGGRIETAAPVVTVGGLEAHPLFAEALLERARAQSTDPGKETIILVAHGYGDDTTNDHWRGVLDHLATWMRSNGGDSFRAIQTGTWREDWPDQREAEVAAIRAMVEAASADGGRAIVIPARTTGQGSEEQFLEGLDYVLGEGFAPSTQFDRWLDEQVAEGARRLGIAGGSELVDGAGPSEQADPPGMGGAEHGEHSHHAHEGH